jgi:hypothetical protein
MRMRSCCCWFRHGSRRGFPTRFVVRRKRDTHIPTPTFRSGPRCDNGSTWRTFNRYGRGNLGLLWHRDWMCDGRRRSTLGGTREVRAKNGFFLKLNRGNRTPERCSRGMRTRTR